MSSLIVHAKRHPVNRRHRKFDRFKNPTPNEIPSLWAELSTLASLTTPERAVGAHLRRSQLLDSVPTWQLTSLLDQLTRPESEEVAI